MGRIDASECKELAKNLRQEADYLDTLSDHLVRAKDVCQGLTRALNVPSVDAADMFRLLADYVDAACPSAEALRRSAQFLKWYYHDYDEVANDMLRQAENLERMFFDGN